MEISGNNVALTGSEAQYIQNRATHGREYDVAQRVLEARAAFARQHLGADAFSDSLPPVKPSARTGPPEEMVLLQLDLHRAETEHGRDASGVERHIIQTTMSPDELAWLRAHAAQDLKVNKDIFIDPDSAYVDPPEEGDDEFHDHDLAAELDADYLDESFAELAVTAGIVRAIDAAQGMPPDSPKC